MGYISNNPYHQPVNAIDISYSHHLTEGNDQERDRASEAVKQSEPVVSRLLGKYESNGKRNQANNTWKKKTH